MKELEYCVCGFDGAGAGGAATLATLLVVDFAPRAEWEPRIGWLQSFNAAGQVAGLLMAATFSSGHWTAGLWAAAAILAPAMLVGGMGLPPSRAARQPNADRRDARIRAVPTRTAEAFEPSAQ